MKQACPWRMGAGLSHSLALFMTSVSIPAAAQLTVQVARQENAFQVEAGLVVAVARRVAWNVLSDYDNLARFVAGRGSTL